MPGPLKKPDMRVQGGLAVAMTLALLLFGRIVGPDRAWACFLLGGAFIAAAVILWALGLIRPGYGVGALLGGTAIASIGVAMVITHEPAVPETPRDPGVYYSAWLRTEPERLKKRLRPGQQVRLSFEAGSRSVLRVETVNLPPEAQRDLRERIRRDFESMYPGKTIEVKLLDSGREAASGGDARTTRGP